jgi:competence protein ComEA
MLRSLLIKLAMLAVAVVLVLWIGWPMPQDPAPQPPPAAISTVTKPPAADPGRGDALSVTPAPMPQRLDVNRASAEDLQQLPGIGPVLAQRIVEWRRTHGAFKQVDELNAVKGIGNKKLQQIRPLVMVGRDKRQAMAGASSKSAALTTKRDIP